MNTILIKNGIIINEGERQVADLLIEGNRISAIEPYIDTTEFDGEIFDATGCYVIPGMIDDQVHFREPGLTHKGTIESESRAAVAGGITSFMEMPNTDPQTTTHGKWQEKMDIAASTSYANYAFKLGGTNDNLDELIKVDQQNVPAIKIFLGSSTGNMLVDDEEVLRKIFSLAPLRISLHCESEEIINANLEKAKEKYGENIPIAQHPVIRSHEACFASSSHAIKLAKETGARIHVFHLSTAEETELLVPGEDVKAKQITAEVCVHHLWFTDEDYGRLGAKIKWNPAVKSAKDRDALWQALNDDRIDVIATDHAPHTIEEKQNKYLNCPSGGPLVQHALVALFDCAAAGKISLEKLVSKTSHKVADLFDIAERGYLRPGYFADVVVIKPNDPWQVQPENILYHCGWSPFEGHTFNHKIAATFVNGHKVYDGHKVSPTKHSMPLTYNR